MDISSDMVLRALHWMKTPLNPR